MIINQRRLSVMIVLLLPFLLVIYSATNDSLRDERYIVPVIDPYVIQSFSDGVCGPFELIRMFQGWEASGWDPLSISEGDLDHVEAVGTAGRRIAGRTQSGYFILDAANSKIQQFNNFDEYSKALAGLHIHNLNLLTPKELARKFSNRQIRPWAYQAMNDSLDLSDVAWVEVTESLGLFLAVMGGLAMANWRRRAIPVIVFAVLVAVLTNYVANYAILDSGPDSFAGILWFPVEFAFAAMIVGPATRWIQKGLSRIA